MFVSIVEKVRSIGLISIHEESVRLDELEILGFNIFCKSVIIV